MPSAQPRSRPPAVRWSFANGRVRQEGRGPFPSTWFAADGGWKQARRPLAGSARITRGASASGIALAAGIAPMRARAASARRDCSFVLAPARPRTIARATSRCRDVCSSRGARCPNSDRRARSPGRSLRPSGRRLAPRLLCHGRERHRRLTLTIASTIHPTCAGRSPQRQAGVRHLGRGRRRPPGVADVCFLRMRSSACRCRLDCGGSRFRPVAGARYAAAA